MIFFFFFFERLGSPRSCSCDPKLLLEYKYFLNRNAAQLFWQKCVHWPPKREGAPKFCVWLLGGTGQTTNGNTGIFFSILLYLITIHNEIFKLWISWLPFPSEQLKHPWVRKRRGRSDLFFFLSSDRTQGRGPKLSQGWDIRGKFLIQRVLRPWNRIPREEETAPRVQEALGQCSDTVWLFCAGPRVWRSLWLLSHPNYSVIPAVLCCFIHSLPQAAIHKIRIICVRTVPLLGTGTGINGCMGQDQSARAKRNQKSECLGRKHLERNL